MLIYTENETESDKRIKNNHLSYKTHQQYTNTFPKVLNSRTFRKSVFFKKTNFKNDQRFMVNCMALSIFCIFGIFWVGLALRGRRAAALKAA